MGIKVFLEATLVSLTLQQALFFKIFEKAQLISLNWFAAQKQTSKSKWQNIGFFYLKFSAKFKELEKVIENCQKMA